MLKETEMLAIVIPAYNRSNLLIDALDSLVCQTKKRFITVVVDDNSEENLQEVINKYNERLHIVYLKQSRNMGPGAARNRGLQWCIDRNIELVMFLDSDDLLFPKAVERLTKEIGITNSNVICSVIQGENSQKGPFTVENSETVWTHGKIYRVSFLKKYKLYFPEFKTNEDLGFNTVVFSLALEQGKAGFINEQLYLWRAIDNSITRQKKDKEKLIVQLSKDFIQAIYYSYTRFLELDLSIEKIGGKILAGLYVYSSYLKELDSFDFEEEEKIRKIYADPKVKEYIQKQIKLGAKGGFAEVKQIDFFLGRTFVHKQNIADYLFEHAEIKV